MVVAHNFISITCGSCGKRLNVPVYCGNRFCQICSSHRRSRVRERLQFLVKNVKLKSGQHFKMITLTIRNEKNLSKMLKRLQKSFKKLRSRAWWKNHVSGGAHVFEITGTPGNWHVHVHAVVAAYYIPFDILLNLWMKLSTGRGVYVQNIPPKAVVNYLTKYLSKAGVSVNLEETVSDSLKGYRLFQPFGEWYAISNTFVKQKSKCSNCGACAFQLTGSLDQSGCRPFRMYRRKAGDFVAEPPAYIRLSEEDLETWVELPEKEADAFLEEHTPRFYS